MGRPKKPLQKGALIFYAIVAAVFGLWTYYLDRNGFVWYSVFPGIVSFLMIMAFLGTLTNREVPPAQDDSLPPGATPLRAGSGAEQVASVATSAAAGLPDNRFDDASTVGVAFRFLRAMREGRYEDGLALADTNWLLCRVQSWIWNNPGLVDHDTSRMDVLAESLVADHQPSEMWEAYVASETQTFRETWAAVDPDKMGAGRDRRRLARHYDLVVLVLLGDTGGYFVNSATTVPNAMTFTLRHARDGWLIANHLGVAPPQPGWPPAWWHSGNPAVDALPDEPQ